MADVQAVIEDLAQNYKALSNTASYVGNQQFTGGSLQSGGLQACSGGQSYGSQAYCGQAYCGGNQYLWPYQYTWWPIYWPTYIEDRYAKAFRIVKALTDKKIVKLKEIKDFIDLVDEIAKVA